VRRRLDDSDVGAWGLDPYAFSGGGSMPPAPVAISRPNRIITMLNINTDNSVSQNDLRDRQLLALNSRLGVSTPAVFQTMANPVAVQRPFIPQLSLPISLGVVSPKTTVTATIGTAVQHAKSYWWLLIVAALGGGAYYLISPKTKSYGRSF
jgi:hypothetical protein